MSLFPAYSEIPQIESTENTNETWLQNSSFAIQLPNKSHEEPDKSSEENEVIEVQGDVQHKIKKAKKRRIEAIPKPTEDELFLIDKKPTKEFLTVKTISRPAVSKYKIIYHIRNNKNRRTKKFKRYYKRHFETDDKIEDIEMKNDESLTQRKASYNKSVRDEPKNVELWMKFIDFQDDLFKFEKTSKKGSIAKGLRANAECKLSILEKALIHNPNSEELHRKRLNIFVSVYPADELQKQLKSLIDKDQENIVLWQGYIEATQCSMSHCNTNSVLKLYINCLSTLHKIRRTTISGNRSLEESILRILYQCGLFLRQSGLFEQLWTLLKMYLEMNLGEFVKNSFEISINTNDKQLQDLEDVVFKSQLPSHELWLRTEKLRELCHFLPITASIDQCEDPQRIVFSEDVVELIQPITMPENTFRLTATIWNLLKIPLLPCRHVTIRELGLDYVPWALDSIETILPIFYKIHSINSDLGNFFIDFQPNVGPQYLKMLPGQEEYLNFILSAMKKCIDFLKGDDKISMIIWWFRFQRFLISLEKENKFNSPTNFRKILRTNIKNLMKSPENRDNTLYYVEYALIEKEMESEKSCLNILKMALSSLQTTKLTENSCYLIRNLIEVSIEMGDIENAMKYLANLISEKPIDSPGNERNVDEILLKFKHKILLILSNYTFDEKLPAVKHFQPILLCDLIICNGWFLYFKKGPLKCGEFLEEILEKIEEKTGELILEKEILYEFYVAVMYKFCVNNPGYGLFKALDDVMKRSLQYFPNNLFLLGILAKESFLLNSLGPKWWTMKTLLLKTGHAIPILMLIYITYQIILNLQEQYIDTITGNKFDVDDSNFKNIMLSLFKSTTKPNICTRRCGLVWRLYLQFIHKYFDSKLCRKTYYCAVEEIPWLKALYIDAAIYIPAELGQIQDLIIEKQLRLHITPEELEVLRE